MHKHNRKSRIGVGAHPRSISRSLIIFYSAQKDAFVVHTQRVGSIDKQFNAIALHACTQFIGTAKIVITKHCKLSIGSRTTAQRIEKFIGARVGRDIVAAKQNCIGRKVANGTHRVCQPFASEFARIMSIREEGYRKAVELLRQSLVANIVAAYAPNARVARKRGTRLEQQQKQKGETNAHPINEIYQSFSIFQ
jgi:hypothetical protein